MEWELNDTLLIGKYGKNKKKHYAMFDLDHTLIKPMNGRRFPSNSDDWEMAYDNVKEKLKEYAKKYNIVIITSQKKVGLNEGKISEFKEKIESICDYLTVPLTLYATLANDMYRKPRIGIVDEYITLTDKSFYVGDAAGRPTRTIDDVKYIKDFADTDYKFALNCDIDFRTPEYEFLDIDDHDYISVEYPIDFDTLEPKNHKFSKRNKEMIMMCGLPGCGKSSYVRKYLDDYVHINQDTLKTKKKCLDAASNAIYQKKNLVIDNTNTTSDTRAQYIKMAKGYKIRALYFLPNKGLCKHNNIYRNYSSGNKIPIVPDVVYNKMAKSFSVPNQKEGFDTVELIDEVQFDDDYLSYMF